MRILMMRSFAINVHIEDIPLLKEMGVKEVFPLGSSLESIVHFIKTNVKGVNE